MLIVFNTTTQKNKNVRKEKWKAGKTLPLSELSKGVFRGGKLLIVLFLICTACSSKLSSYDHGDYTTE